MTADDADTGDFRDLLGEDVIPLTGDTPLLLKRLPELTPGTLERRRAFQQQLRLL